LEYGRFAFLTSPFVGLGATYTMFIYGLIEKRVVDLVPGVSHVKKCD